MDGFDGTCGHDSRWYDDWDAVGFDANKIKPSLGVANSLHISFVFFGLEIIPRDFFDSLCLCVSDNLLDSAFFLFTTNALCTYVRAQSPL